MPTQVPTLFYNASPLTEEAQPDNPFQFTALVTTSMPVRSLTSLDESAQIAGEGEMTLVALAERRMASDSTEDAGKIEDLSGIVVVGDSNFLTDQFLLQGANETLASNLVYYMSRNQQVMGVQPRRAVATVLAPKVTWYRPVFFLMIGVLPIVFLGGGVTVWLRRKAA